MSKICKTILILILFTLLTPAAPVALVLQYPPPPPPQPSREYSPAGWDDYVSEKGKFRARFPNKPKEFVETNPNNVPNTYVVLHKGILNYGISYIDLPKTIDDLAERHEVLKNKRDAALSAAQAYEPKIIKEGEADVKGQPGYFIHIELKAEVAGLKWVLVGNRLYTILASGRKGSPKRNGGKG